jgi:hypothetical protein
MPKPEFDLPAPRRVRDDLLKLLGPEPDAAKLAGALRLLAKYRSHLIQWELARSHDAEVRTGPFRGMTFVDHSAEGCHVPKMLGCYEQELQPYFEAAIASGYDDVVNVGCAEGYYAVGLALRMPRARIHAYDIDGNARALCERIARQNHVAERVRIAEAFTPAGFRAFAQRRALFLIDIEGSELELFAGASRDDVAPFDFIVECHDAAPGKVSAPLLERLAPTHHVRLVKHGLPSPEFPPLLENAGHLDQLLAVWEWRGHPTPWLVAASRGAPATPFSAAVAGASS